MAESASRDEFSRRAVDRRSKPGSEEAAANGGRAQPLWMGQAGEMACAPPNWPRGIVADPAFGLAVVDHCRFCHLRVWGLSPRNSWRKSSTRQLSPTCCCRMVSLPPFALKLRWPQGRTTESNQRVEESAPYEIGDNF